MEKIVIICFSSEIGINPFIQDVKDEFEIVKYVKSLVPCVYKEEGPGYVEVYRVCDGGWLSFYRCFSYDGESLKKCLCMKPSLKFLKKFVEDYSFKSLKL